MVKQARLGRKISSRVSLVIALLLIVGAVALVFYNYRLLLRDVEKGAHQTLSVITALHSQSMLQRKTTDDNDHAVAVLNGTFALFNDVEQDIRLWLVMSPKVLEYQRRQGAKEIEPPRDELDHRAIETGEVVSEFVSASEYRLTVPVVIGRYPADYARCVSCHYALMGVGRGETIGAFSIAVDWGQRREAFFSGVWMTLLGVVLVVVLVSLLIKWLVNCLVGRPLSDMADVMSRLAGGDLAASVGRYVNEDEIGVLADALEVFRTGAIARREAEKSVRLLGQAIEQSRSLIFVTDDNANIIYVNRAITDTMGYMPEAVVGKNLQALSAGESFLTIYREMWDVIRSGNPWSGELLYRKIDGGDIWVSANIAPVLDPDGVTTHYVVVIQDVTERKRATEEARFLAYHDLLTRLPNRTLFCDRLTVAIAGAQRRSTQLAVLLIDLKGFSSVNDTLGHAVGDKLIGAVAERLRKSDSFARFEHGTARLGGDEFAVLLQDVAGQQGAMAVAERLLKLFARPFVVAEHTVHTEVSVGVVLSPEHGSNVSDLLRRVDLALQEAKERVGSAYCMYQPTMESSAFARVGLEQDLAMAIEKGQLWLAYQPQVDPVSRRVCGLEALLRWTHPTRGAISPVVFIPVAESSRLIVRIGVWVIEEVCRQLAKWRDEGYPLVPVAVNLSPLQVGEEELPGQISALLEKYQIPADLLPLEITESSFLRQSDSVARMMHELTRSGHHFALDDFGTGYSSLSYLAKFPFSKIKIDRAFVRNIHLSPGNAAIVRATIALGHELGMTVNAEGAEFPEEFSLLATFGVDEVQGYFFSVPRPPEEIPAFIAEMASLSDSPD